MLELEIKERFNQARREQNKNLRAAFESVLTKALYEKKSGKYSEDTLPDEIIQNIISKVIKETKETQFYYKPEDDKYKELEEQISELSKYLPKEMSEEEVKNIIKNIISSGEKNMGKIIGATIKAVGNSFDKSKISGLVKEELC